MEKNKIFKKFQSFQRLLISKSSSEKEILEKIQKIFQENLNGLDKYFSMAHQKILSQVLNDLFSDKEKNIHLENEINNIEQNEDITHFGIGDDEIEDLLIFKLSRAPRRADR